MKGVLMMKRMITMGLMLLLCLVLVSGCGSVEGSALFSGVHKKDLAGAGEVIGKSKATSTALEHAGLAQSEVKRIEVEQELEKGRQIYEVEFYAGESEYEYKIDALTGEVLSFEQELKKKKAAPVTKESPAAKTGTSAQAGSSTKAGKSSKAAPAPAPKSKASGAVNKDGAVAAALKHAGFSRSQVSRLEVERDYEKGRQVYEVEFYVGASEYEYKIDVASGKVLSYEMEVKKSKGSGQTAQGGKLIGKTAAKSKALKHAGLSQSQISRLEIELDYENGRRIYEVEFISGNKEYEYEIDAYSGAIVSYEVESRKSK